MATMYVYNIPTNETVNLRKTPGSTGTILVRVGYGKAVEASYYNATWHSATYNGYSGYIMSKYLTSTNPNGNGGNTGTGTGTPTAGIIKGTSVRVRKEPNTTSEILTQVNTGDKVTFYAGESYSRSGYNWYRCTSSKWSGNGYIATNYVVKDDGSTSSGDSDYAIRATVDTVKHGVGGTLNMRASASSGSSVVTTISNGATIYVKSMSGEWLAAKYNNYTGYVMAKFVVGTDAYNGSTGGNTGSGSSDDFSDNVTTNPIVNTHYTFRPSAAVDYAKTHSSNTNKDSNGNDVADPKRNKSFGEGSSNACANFVHQCLLAGGARMFDGWCYKLTGIPSTWDSESWTLTNKGRRRLLEKKWIERIPVTSVKAGDIIYTYYSDYENREKMKTPFNHVTIAISDYSSSDGGCYVCGHTTNQNNKFKKLSDTGIPCAYCYRVKSSLGGDGTEKAIDLTDGNSKAI